MIIACSHVNIHWSLRKNKEWNKSEKLKEEKEIKMANSSSMLDEELEKSINKFALKLYNSMIDTGKTSN